MNPEIPSNSESDNTNFEPIESSDELRSDKVPTVTSDAIEDIWLSDDDVTDVMIEAEESDLIEQTEPQRSQSDSPTATETRSPDITDSNESNLSSEEAEPELFVDSWLDEPEANSTTDVNEFLAPPQTDEIAELEAQKSSLHREIEQLKAQKEQMLLQQARDVQEHMGRMVEEGTKELKERKMALQIEIEKLERRKERINQEMRSNFAGSSQELAVRIQGFKNYLVGSLQDLATAAEKLELSRPEAEIGRAHV